MPFLNYAVWDDAREVAIGPPEQINDIAVGAGSTQGDVIAPTESGKRKLKRVRVMSDVNCRILWGENPTAADDGTSMPVGSENPEYIGVEAGHRIAVIQR